MFDFKDEFLALVDLYHIQDGATRLIKAQELEDAFAERLQAELFAELTEQQRDEIIQKATEGSDPAEIVETMFAMIEDIDTFVDEVFEEFKAEFKSNII